MRLKRMREQGLAEPVKTCTVCGKKLKKGAGANKAWSEGLCWEHWKQSEPGKKERRRQNLKKDLWAVAFFIDDGKKVRCFSSARQALRATKAPRLMVVTWSDGRFTCHTNCTFASVQGMTPESGDLLLDWTKEMEALIPDEKRAWFWF